jgi:predicted amidohydrolase
MGNGMNLTIALLQILPHEMDQEYNLEKGVAYCKKAKSLGADIALFPEVWNIGYAMCPFDESGRTTWEDAAIDRESAFFRTFGELAQDLQMHIAISYLEKYHPKPRNTVSVINTNGDVALNYSKVYICDFGKEQLLEENPNYDDIGCDYNCAPGDSFPVCTLNVCGHEVNIGAMICADREFPEGATQLMLSGADIILVPNSCHWDALKRAQLRVRAFENFLGIAMTNYPSPKCNGHSSAYHCMCWDEIGKERDNLVVEAGEAEGIYLATFDLDAMRAFRELEKWRVDYRKRPYNRLSV